MLNVSQANVTVVSITALARRRALLLSSGMLELIFGVAVATKAQQDAVYASVNNVSLTQFAAQFPQATSFARQSVSVATSLPVGSGAGGGYLSVSMDQLVPNILMGAVGLVVLICLVVIAITPAVSATRSRFRVVYLVNRRD